MMAINPGESTSFHAANCEMDTGPDQFIEAFFMPDSQKGSYQDFLNSNGFNATGELRNTTDDLSIKFLEGSSNAFPPYQQNGSQAQAAAAYPMYTKKCMSMPTEGSHGKAPEQVRNITRSFSLIMAAFEQDSIGAGPNPMMGTAQQYPEKKYPEMQPQYHQHQQQMYNKYGEGVNSNHSSGTFMPLPEHVQQEQTLQKVPQKRVDELLSNLRSKVGAPLKKQRSSSDQDMHQSDVSKGYRRATPFDDAESFQQANAQSRNDPIAANQNASANPTTHGYERNISIGTRLFRALQRTRTENVDSAAARRAARQQMRVKKTTKQPSVGSSNAAASMTSSLPQSQSSQPHFEMEILAQRTRVIMQEKESILQENEKLKSKLDMVNRLNSAQATKLEEMKQKK